MKIAICGNYGAQNWGDEMILEGLLKSLQDFGRKTEIVVLSGNPRETAKRHGVKSVPHLPSGIRSTIKSLIKNKTRKALKDADLFILGGGGLFSELTVKANIIWAAQAAKAQKLGIPVIMYGQSVGGVRNLVLRQMIAEQFNNSKLIAVRDEKSKERLRSFGVEKKIHIVADLAFKNKTREIKKEKYAIIALRHLPKLSQKFKKEIADFIVWLKEDQELKIKLISFQKNDQKLNQSVKELIKNTEGIKLINPKSTSEINSLYTRASYTLGMRLHSIITAIKTKTPFTAINYANKVHDLLQTAEMKENIIELDKLSYNGLIKKYKENKNDPEKFAKYIKSAKLSQKNFETKHLYKLLSSLSKTPRA